MLGRVLLRTHDSPRRMLNLIQRAALSRADSRPLSQYGIGGSRYINIPEPLLHQSKPDDGAQAPEEGVSLAPAARRSPVLTPQGGFRRTD